jgi:hypothetical protein
MPGIFDGTWRSNILAAAGPRSDAPFQLEEDPSNHALRNSTHGGLAVTGTVTGLGIEITHEFSQQVKLVYTGHVLGEIVVRGVKHLVIGGMVRIITPGPGFGEFDGSERFEAIREILAMAQEQEIWVATKP